MKIRFVLVIVSVLGMGTLKAQEADSSQWEFSADVNFYYIPDDFFVLPIFKADKDKLHLEARYNYEDYETFSAWIGYNFSGGKKLEYTITPMLGGVVGLTDGIAPGLEFTLTLNRFELYSESEYLFDLESKGNNYYYNWTDLSYSPTDWLWVGLSVQRTQLYQTDLDIQRGLLVGAALKKLEFTGYFFDLTTDDAFIVLTVSLGF